MKLKILLILVLILKFSVALSAIKWVDRIVMVVNDDIVTERDVNDMMFNIKKQSPKNIKISPKNLKEAAMQRLLEEKLLVQFANNVNIVVSQEEIDNQINLIASSRKISITKLYDIINKDGVDKEVLRNTIRNNLLVEKVLKEFLPSESPVTEDEVNELLTKNKIPLNKDNIERATLFISRQKFQQSYMELIENLRSSSYIKINEKPY